MVEFFFSLNGVWLTFDAESKKIMYPSYVISVKYFSHFSVVFATVLTRGVYSRLNIICMGGRLFII